MRYGKMLQYAYPAIKAADPEAKVLIGGLLLDCDPENPPAGKDCAAGRFLEGILEAGGGPYFDVVSFHAYSYYGGTIGDMTNPNWEGSSTGVAEKVAFLRRVLGDYGCAEKTLMNTEAALLCPEDTGDCRDTQASYVSKAYADAIRLGLRAQVYYAMTGSWRHSGLLEPALTPKPVYYAYQAAASFLSGATYVGPVSDYPANVVGHAFRRPGSGATVDLVWLSDGSSLYVSLPGGASAYDQYGNLITSSGAVALGYAPVYIVRP
jgi:hypothetical protein